MIDTGVDLLHDLSILLIGLNVAWMETAFNGVIAGGESNLMGWPVFNFYLTSVEWFWIHLVLTMIFVATLITTYNLKKRG